MPLDDEQAEIDRLYRIEFEHGGCRHLRERDNAELTTQRDDALRQRDAALGGGLTVVRSFEQWRVTGRPADGPPVDHTWIPATADQGESELAARRFVAAQHAAGRRWDDGPHLHRRVVLYTGWQPADTEPGPPVAQEDR